VDGLWPTWKGAYTTVCRLAFVTGKCVLKSIYNFKSDCEAVNSIAWKSLFMILSKLDLEGRIEMTGRRGRRRKHLLDDLKEKRRYWKLKEEALDRTLWRTRFG
jgi:hypothetical protein